MVLSKLPYLAFSTSKYELLKVNIINLETLSVHISTLPRPVPLAF